MPCRNGWKSIRKLFSTRYSFITLIMFIFMFNIYFFGCLILLGFLYSELMNSILITAEPPSNPCQPSPCGVNAECRQRDGAGACTCIEGYQGNPYEGCRPECVLSADCSSKLACIRNHCVDPCPGTCGVNAICSVANHVPTCYCIENFEGDPFQGCRPIPQQGTISIGLFICINYF